jgi:hypothetical protein
VSGGGERERAWSVCVGGGRGHPATHLLLAKGKPSHLWPHHCARGHVGQRRKGRVSVHCSQDLRPQGVLGAHVLRPQSTGDERIQTALVHPAASAHASQCNELIGAWHAPAGNKGGGVVRVAQSLQQWGAEGKEGRGLVGERTGCAIGTPHSTHLSDNHVKHPCKACSLEGLLA